MKKPKPWLSQHLYGELIFELNYFDFKDLGNLKKVKYGE
jgi:hypothetical protein